MHPAVQDIIRRVRRLNTDSLSVSGLKYRKIFLIIFGVAIILLYFGPSVMRWLFSSSDEVKDTHLRCLDDRLTPFFASHHSFDSVIHIPSEPVEYIPYIGNGYFGLTIEEDAHVNIRFGRGLDIGVNFHPIISLSQKNGERQEATVTDYVSGLVHRYQCFEGFQASYVYYAHRTMPSIFVQEIEIANTKNQLVDAEIIVPRISEWLGSSTKLIQLEDTFNTFDYQVVTGTVALPENSKVLVVSIVSRQLQRVLTLRKRGTTKLNLLTSVYYSEPVARTQVDAEKLKVETQAIDAMKRALKEVVQKDASFYRFRRQHIEVWQNLWFTGFQISISKADNSLNGDRINATIYACLSQVRAYEFEESVTPARKQEIAHALTYAEGCYGGYHTLQADNLWKGLTTLEETNSLVAAWLLTLEKQGCHNLLKAGASGVIQAMVLSFGGFRFSNQHLEFHIHPKFLHRDYHFRRLNYGNWTHVNVSVSVNEDNKALLFVSVDRDEKQTQYYACDAGCLDEPIPIGQTKIQFPVKLTEPLTSILYITSDREHMETLKHALHVKEVVEAPAHQSHLIALHKHGHSIGGLPTLFWFSICLIIIVFHVFLCKLIVKEYCEPPDKVRYRYLKP